VLGSEPRDVGADLRVMPVLLEISPQPGSRVAEQRVVDESKRRRRAFDVEEDDADVLQLDLARSGMWVGPRQSGWYPRSAPLLV
jgi:hypothetical protein